MFIFQVSWIMAFLCMVMVNWQLRFSPNWLPEGVARVSQYPGLLATAALLLSAFLVKRALDAIKQDDTQGFLKQWGVAIALGLLFVLVMLFEWITIQSGTQYAQVFRLMTGFHVFHAVAIGGYMFQVFRSGQAGDYGATHFWDVEAGAKLWYFVLVAWIIFYVVIYWV